MALNEARKALEEERFEDAITILEELNGKETEPETLVYLGIAYVQTEQPQKAVDVLRQAEEEVEDHCVLCLFLGRALKALGDFSEAKSCLKRAIELEPESPEAWEDLANILFEQKEYGVAVQVLLNSITHFPRNVSLRGLNAICHHRLGDYTTAEREWRAVLDERPESLMVLASLAYVLILQERYSEAKQLIEKIGKLDSSDYRFQLLQAEILFQDEKLHDAVSYYEGVLSNNPDNLQALCRLSRIHHELSDEAQSRFFLEEAEGVKNSHPQCWRGLSVLYAHLDLREKVLDSLIHGTEVDKGSAAPWIALALEYDRLGRTDDAYHAWKMSFDLRGYIKIYCKKCKDHFSLPHSNNLRFLFHREQICPVCGNDIPMPEGLSRV